MDYSGHSGPHYPAEIAYRNVAVSQYPHPRYGTGGGIPRSQFTAAGQKEQEDSLESRCWAMGAGRRNERRKHSPVGLHRGGGVGLAGATIGRIVSGRRDVTSNLPEACRPDWPTTYSGFNVFLFPKKGIKSTKEVGGNIR